jgi:arsenate reductase
MKNVLVLCTGNSCRSIIAEYLINSLSKGAIKAASAGSMPTGLVHPKSIETLARHGIATVNPRSKSWDEFSGKPIDLVITVCDNAANEPCPAFIGRIQKIHWSIPDPAKVTESEPAIDKAFEDTFQMLKARIETELL